MTNDLTFANIHSQQIVYDRDSGLFPFSPRTEINSGLVTRLQDSIAEVGMIQPIILRRGTLEGIAGNHRFLAYLQWAVEQGQAEDEINVPAILVNCDEATAVRIALIENEIRNNLTDWETVRALLQITKRKPKAAERVFKMDRETATQLEFWPNQLKTPAAEEQGHPKGSSRLTREWLHLIKNRLADHPALQDMFLKQLRQPNWVQARTLNDLNREITDALLQHGIQFESGRTWNYAPTSKCLGHVVNYNQLTEQLRSDPCSIDLQPDGSIPDGCPYLRLVPQYIQQYASNQAEGCIDSCPSVTLDQNEGLHPLLDRVDAYCVALDVHDHTGCFNLQEKKAIESRIRELSSTGLPAMSPAELATREADGEFFWRNPVYEGQRCTPETCCHARDTRYGYALVVQPGQAPQMVCIHAECGKAAQAALVDYETLQRAIEKQRYSQALEQLCRVTVFKTLFLEKNENNSILTPAILEEIERQLVPTWDTLTMQHVLTGWQQEIRHRIAAELGLGDPASKPVMTVFSEQFGGLAGKPNKTTIPSLFYQLRALILAQSEGLERWISCLALTHSWRDSIRTIQEIETNPLYDPEVSID